MGSRIAVALLVLSGVLHLGTLVGLSVPQDARPPSAGDIAVLAGGGILYLVAAGGMAMHQRWGRRLGLIVSGLEAVPAAALLYPLVVFSADPAGRGSLTQIVFMAALVAPVVVFFALWSHKPREL